MNKVYSVIIRGRTLESRDLKELLARAVVQKKVSDRKLLLQNLSRGATHEGNEANAYFTANQAVSL